MTSKLTTIPGVLMVIACTACGEAATIRPKAQFCQFCGQSYEKSQVETVVTEDAQWRRMSFNLVSCFSLLAVLAVIAIIISSALDIPGYYLPVVICTWLFSSIVLMIPLKYLVYRKFPMPDSKKGAQ